MSDQQVEKYDEFGDLSLSVAKDENSNLDEYGVWIKKKPSADEQVIQNELHSNDEEDEAVIEEEKDIPFDFDGLDENDSSDEDSFTKELKGAEQSLDASSSEDTNFDDVDMSNFFTDLGDAVENEEVTKKEEEEALKMDLNFDTMDSYMNEEDKDDFDDILNVTDSSGDSELDDFVSDLNSSTSGSQPKDSSDSTDHLEKDMDLSIDVDENQDFSDIGQATDSEESVALPSLAQENNETPKEKKTENSVVIKNTIVEPENIEEIREENRKVMGEEEVKKHEDSFNDVEALANDLTSDVGDNLSLKSSGHVSVEGMDKITELLSEIVKEISSLKAEISALKIASNSVIDEKKLEEKKEEPEEATGFFKDEDTDEAIALTGDELNNILITADFTEEDEPNAKTDDDVIVAEDVGTCEACSDDVKEKIEDDFSDENDVDFDDITLENSKLDDFVIPEELDYSMLNSDDGKIATTEGSDMSYLDEKDAEDDVSIDIPETQDIAIENVQDDSSIEKTSENAKVCENAEDSNTLPSNIKEEVKSVLSYMDQLLDSLPEDKIKEFADSEYFEMYKRLFSELGIS